MNCGAVCDLGLAKASAGRAATQWNCVIGGLGAESHQQAISPKAIRIKGQNEPFVHCFARYAITVQSSFDSGILEPLTARLQIVYPMFSRG